MPGDGLVSETSAQPRSELAATLAVLLAAACWGTSGLFIKLIGIESTTSAFALAFWRNLFAFAILLTGLGLLRPDQLRIHRSDLRWLVALGACLGLLNTVWIVSVSLNGVTVAALQQSATPAIVAVAAWLFWREPLTRSKVVAIALTIAGTGLVSGANALGQAEPSLVGLLAGLAVPVAYATWNLLGKKIRFRYSPIATLTYAFGFGALVLLPFQFLTPAPWPFPSSALLWFAGLVVVSTLIPFLAYTSALGELPASVVSILAMSEIAFAAFFAHILLGERLSVSQVAGAVLILGGVVLLSWHRWHTERRARRGF
jgi:drug/metabolite transporter (DMT)-like permease